MGFHRANATASDLDDLYLRLKIFIGTTIGMTEKKTGTSRLSREYAVYESLGVSTQDEIRFGMTTFLNDESAPTPSAKCGLQFNGYTGYDVNKDFDDQPGATKFCPSLSCCGFNGTAYSTVWDQSMEYWFIGDEDMVSGVIRTNVFYVTFYVGLLRRYALRTQDCYPMLVDGSGFRFNAGTCCFGFSQRSMGNCTGGGYSCYQSRLWGGACWCCVRTHANIEGEAQVMWPSTLADSRLYGGNYLIFPIGLGYPNGDRGEYKWIYKPYGDGLNAEDTITVDGNQYLVFPDVTSPGDDTMWIALRDYDDP